MLIWLNGAFGSGKTTTAYELNRRLPDSFVYDPENVGYFIRRNAPKVFSNGDFQDIPQWRGMNYEMLKMITEAYTGTLIVPMTLVNPEYYQEIIGKLIADGVDVRHFIIYASKGEIRHRIQKRTFPLFGNDAFAMDSVDRCVDAFDTVITDMKIQTDNMRVDDVVEKIAELCGVELSSNRKTAFGKFLYRKKVMLKHIR